MITNVQYINEDQTTIRATVNDITYSIPANENNRHYQMIIEWLAESPSNEISAYVPLTPEIIPLPRGNTRVIGDRTIKRI